MPHEPKRRHSRARKGKRRAAISLVVAQTVLCANCKALTPAHTVCAACGFYRGKEIIKKEAKATVTRRTKTTDK